MTNLKVDRTVQAYSPRAASRFDQENRKEVEPLCARQHSPGHWRALAEAFSRGGAKRVSGR